MIFLPIIISINIHTVYILAIKETMNNLLVLFKQIEAGMLLVWFR